MSEPLTDENLQQWSEWADNGSLVEGSIISALVAEVRRLRSDEWLERVVAEYRELTPGGDYGLLAILKKHRDGEDQPVHFTS